MKNKSSLLHIGFKSGFLTKLAQRIRIEVIARNKAGDIMLGKQQKEGDTWYMFPGGGVEPDETLEDAARREFAEEVGKNLRNVKMLSHPPTDVTKPDYHSRTYYVTGQLAGGPSPKNFGADQDIIENLLWANPQKAQELLYLNPMKEAGKLRAKVIQSLKQI